MTKAVSPRFASRRAANWHVSFTNLRASAKALASLSTLLLGAAAVPRAEAANNAWSTNPGDGTFTGANWTTGTTTPGARTGTIASGDSLYFGASSITTLNEDEAAGFNIASFTFNAGASAYTITGNSFALGVGGITNNSTNLQTINDAFTIANAGTALTTTTGGGNLRLGGVISGAGGLTVAGTGTTTLGGVNTFTGGTTVNSGTLVLGAGGGAGTLRGIVTVNTGATLTLGVNNALGYTSGSQVTTLNVNGGTVNVSGGFGDEGYITSFNLTGGTMAYASGGAYQIAAGDGSLPRVTSNASSTTSVISGGLQIRSGNLPIVVASGTTASGVDLLISGNLTGNLPFTKSGAGVLALSGTNAYTSATISAGTLAATTNALVGNITNNSALVIDQTLAATPLGSGTTAAVISGTGTVAKNNAGAAILTGANTYTGATNVNGGILYVNGSLNAASAISVASGARLGGRGTVGTATVAAGGNVEGGQGGSGTLTLSALTFSGGGTIFFNTIANNATAPALAAGALTANGGANSINLTVTGALPGAGTYQLLSYTGGAVGGAGQSAFILTPLPNRATGSLDLSQPGLVQVNVTGATDFLIYTGGTTNTFDTTNPNFKLNSNGAATTYIDPSDSVVFDDTAGAAHSTVSINAGNVSPNSLTFNNSTAVPYTLQGANGVAGPTSLVKNGTGTLTINTANTYTGGTVLNGGTISLGNAGALGSAGTITLGGGTLQYGPANNTDYSARFSTAANQAYNIDTNGRAVTFATALTSAGGTLTKSGAGTLLLTANNTFTGATTVNGGTLELGADSGLYAIGTTAGNLNVNAGGTVRFSRNDSLGGSGVVSPVVVTVNGGALASNGFFTSLSSPFFNGATIIDNGGSSTGFASFRLTGTVTVGGTVPTNIVVGTVSPANGINLGVLNTVATTTFNVADVTNDATSDFNVNVPVYNTGGAASGLTLTGAGTMSLNAANAYTGPTTISSGTLQIGNGGTAGSLSSSSVITNNGSLVFRRSDLVTQGIQFSGTGISGTGRLTQAGTGALVLTAAETYTGATAVDAGTLYVNGSLANASAVSVASGARLGGTGTVGTATVASGGSVEGGQNNAGTLTLSGLTLGGNATAFFGNLANYTAVPAIAAGALTVNGGANSVMLMVNGTVPGGIGTYQLISYTGGAIGGTGQSVFALGTLPNRATGNLDFSQPGLVDLKITGSDFLIYTGGTTNTFNTTNPTFKLNSNNAATTYIDNPGDSVVFDDTAGPTHTTVNINAGDVRPTSVTFNNSTLNYTLQGANAIAGTNGLTKTGTGTLTITNTNTYTGLTAINGGIVALGSAGALGTSGTITLGGGRLQYGPANNTDYSARFSTAANQAYNIDTNGQSVTFATALTSAGGSLTKLGAGALTLSGNSTFSGPTNVNGGTLILSGAGSLYNNGGTAGTVNVGPGATLMFNGNDALGGSGNLSPVVVTVNGGTLAGNGTYTSLTNPVLNGATINANGGTNTNFPGFSLRGTVTVGGTAPTNINVGTLGTNANTQQTTITIGTLNAATPDSVTFNVADATSSPAADLVVNTGLIAQTGGVGGANGLIKTGAGTMMLTATNTYTGPTTVNAGTLIVTGNLASATVAVNGTGSVFGGAGDGTVTGSVSGAVNVGSGAILSAGNRALSATGTLLISGAVTFAAGSTFDAVVADANNVSTLVPAGITLSGAAFSITLAPGATFANGTVLTLIAYDFVANGLAFTNTTYTTGGYLFTADYTTDPSGYFDVDVTAVPEPASWAGFALMGLVGVSRRKKLKAWLNMARG